MRLPPSDSESGGVFFIPDLFRAGRFQGKLRFASTPLAALRIVAIFVIKL